MPTAPKSGPSGSRKKENPEVQLRAQQKADQLYRLALTTHLFASDSQAINFANDQIYGINGFDKNSEAAESLLKEIVRVEPTVHRYTGTIATILITSVLFAVIHGLTYAIPIFFLALALGWLRIKTGNLKLCFALHTLNNITAVIANHFFE